MLLLHMHLNTVNFLWRNKIGGFSLTITGYRLKGVDDVPVHSLHGEINVAIGLTTDHHLTAFYRAFFSGMQDLSQACEELFDGSARTVTLRATHHNFKGRAQQSPMRTERAL